MQKIEDIDYFYSEILMIKEYCNLIGREHIFVHNLKLYSQIAEKILLLS